MQLCRISLLVLIICLVFSGSALSEEQNAKVIKAVKIGDDELPEIDGKLDDKCWGKAGKVGDFMQFEPVLGAPPKDSTKVYVLFSKEKLYIGFECSKKNPGQVTGMAMKRDSYFFQDDFVEVFLDTYHDRRNCYSFAVNCLGTQVDKRIANEGSGRSGGPRGDRSRAWDCSWQAKSSKNNKGWTAEMAIPFSELRFNKKGDGTWGINFWRGNEEFDEEDTWADVGERELAVSKFGILTGLTPDELEVSRPLEFKPYATIKPRISPESDVDYATGIDIRYPASNITTDLTFNPDFAQIEADPAEINLDDVELKLAEKRPFFQEGMELFQTPIELFYTRRVGAKKFKYGAKAVGKLGAYNLALLDCQADDRVDDPEEEDKEENELERDNNYFVLRTQRDIGRNSSIGIIGVNKQKVDGYNRLGGIDLNLSLPMEMKLAGQYAASWLPDKSDDAFILKLDGSKKSVSFDLEYSDVGPDFEAESGFIPRTDRRGGGASIRHEYTREAKVFRMFRSRIGYDRLHNHDGLRTNERISLDLMARLYDFFVSFEPGWYYHVNEDDESIGYNDRGLSLFAGWFPPRWASVRMRTVIGERENRDLFLIGPEISFTPVEKLRLEISVERLDEEGERLKLNRRIEASYQFTHQMFLRSIFEVTRDDTRSMFLLYGWEYRPESNFFIVYTDSKDGDDIDRIIFVKLSYLLKWNIF